MEVRRLRGGVRRVGGSIGLSTQAVVRFSEAISGQRWKRCRPSELERVLADLDLIRSRMRLNMLVQRKVS
jgi:hypothetical protein